MRRTAPSVFLLAAISGCGESQFKPIEEVELTGSDATTDAPPVDDSSSSSSGDAASSGDDTSSSPSTSSGDETTTGDPSDSTAPTNTCGDGEVDDGEDCDGGAPQLCSDLGSDYTWGEAKCSPGCTLDVSACQTCDAPTIAPCDAQSDDPFHAIELGCADMDGWGASNGVPLLSRTWASPDLDAYRVLRQFGSHKLPGDVPAWGPRAGERMLLISTGKLLGLDILDVLLMPPGAATSGSGNANPESEAVLPPPMRINMAGGSTTNDPFRDCDGVGDCSQTLAFQWLPSLQASDIAYLDLQIRVPAGTRGYALDLALFTTHYPEYSKSAYNDMAIVWTESEAYVGNIAYLLQDGLPRPLALPSLSATGLVSHSGLITNLVHDDPAMAGTGFDGVDGEEGGATDWLTLHGPAVPGEALTLAIAVLDLDDSFLDSALLIDNFRWRCESCTLGAPTAAGGCGLRPASP